MARQNRGPGVLHFKKNCLGLGLLFIFILALIVNSALSSKPTQNVRFKRDDDEEVLHSFENLTGDGLDSNIREKLSTEKVQGDVKTNKNKKSSSNDPEDIDADNTQTEEPWWNETSSSASASVSDATSPKSHLQEEENTTKTEDDEDDGDEDEDGDGNDGDELEYDSTPDTSTASTGTIASLEKAMTRRKNATNTTTEANHRNIFSNATENAIPSDETSGGSWRNTSILNNNTSSKTDDQDSASFRLSNMAELTISIVLLHLSRI